jgi:hypothetical protein
MKQYLILLFAFFTLGSLHAQKNTKDQDAVRKVIELETKYFFDGNYDKWATTWAHESTDYVIFTGPNGNSETIGWDNISAGNKPNMKNVPLISPDELATTYKKYDYQYKINGNLANVTFREGKGNFQTKTLEKQNGEWKITGMTLVNSTDFKFKVSYNTLKSYVGKWKLVEGSYKSENLQGTTNNDKLMTADYDIHETMYGIEFASSSSSVYSGITYFNTASECFIPDNNQNEIKYFDFEKGTNADISTSTGTAVFDTSGRFVVKGMYPDKPAVVRFENIYTTNGDGSIHHEGRSYDKDGKLTFKWFFDLHRV